MFSQRSAPADSELPFSSPLAQLKEELSYLQHSWIWQEKAVIWVTGANTWLGRYLLHLLTQENLPTTLVAVASDEAPSYLKQKRYQKVVYYHIAPGSSQKEYYQLSQKYPPRIVFHAQGLRFPGEKDPLELYRSNVRSAQQICQAFTPYTRARMILFSDSTVYRKAESLAREDEEASPCLALGKSSLELEQLALHYQQSNWEILSLRLGPCFGPLVNSGVMVLGYLLEQGFFLSPFQELPQQITPIHAKDAALSAFLLALAPRPGYQIFNIASDPMSFRALLSLLAENLQATKLLGISHPLVNILGIGYQEEICLPGKTLEFFGLFRERFYEFTNHLRYQQKHSVINRQICIYALELRALSNKRLADMIGWVPAFPHAELAQSKELLPKIHWSSFRKQECKSEPLIQIYEELTPLVEQMEKFSPQREEIEFVEIPRLGWQVDLKSLWILSERFKHSLPLLLSNKRGKKERHPLSHLRWLKDSLLTVIRYQEKMAAEKFPNDPREEIRWLTQEIGRINIQTLNRYLLLCSLGQLITTLEQRQQEYQKLLEVFPNKSYGIFVASDLGDIGISVKIKNGNYQITFMRELLQDFSGGWSLGKKIIEFKKQAGLQLVAGAKLEVLLQDILQNSLLHSFFQNYDRDYLISHIKKEHLDLFGQREEVNRVNRILFLNQNQQVEFGVLVSERELTMLSPLYIQYINQLLQQLSDPAEVMKMVGQATDNQEEIVFLRLKTIKKILADLPSLARLPRIIIKIIERRRKSHKPAIKK